MYSKIWKGLWNLNYWYLTYEHSLCVFQQQVKGRDVRLWRTMHWRRDRLLTWAQTPEINLNWYLVYTSKLTMLWLSILYLPKCLLGRKILQKTTLCNKIRFWKSCLKESYSQRVRCQFVMKTRLEFYQQKVLSEYRYSWNMECCMRTLCDSKVWQNTKRWKHYCRLRMMFKYTMRCHQHSK